MTTQDLMALLRWLDDGGVVEDRDGEIVIDVRVPRKVLDTVLAAPHAWVSGQRLDGTYTHPDGRVCRQRPWTGKGDHWDGTWEPVWREPHEHESLGMIACGRRHD